MSTARPIVAHAIGCPAGIAPEISARVLADDAVRRSADVVVLGDARVLRTGAQAAGVQLEITSIAQARDIEAGKGPYLIDLANLDPGSIAVGELSKAAGDSALAAFRMALDLARAGAVDAVTFSPFNKAAMRLSDPGYVDEITFANAHLDFAGAASEYNILAGLWNARVTSHIPLADVAPQITRANVLRHLVETARTMRAAGFASPRIGVAALNPHAGDNGNFGREEIDEIAPAVADAQAAGIACEGPLPADTIFLGARSGRFDAVLTMYHDQGQIAMKLLGFEDGVTLLAGYPFPIVTAAHGSAYDIAGRGLANPQALRNALLLAARMSRSAG